MTVSQNRAGAARRFRGEGVGDWLDVFRRNSCSRAQSPRFRPGAAGAPICEKPLELWGVGARGGVTIPDCGSIRGVSIVGGASTPGDSIEGITALSGFFQGRNLWT